MEMGHPEGQGHPAPVLAAVRGSERQEKGIPFPLERSAASELHRERGWFYFGDAVPFARAQACAAAQIQLSTPRQLLPNFPAGQMIKTPSRECLNFAET